MKDNNIIAKDFGESVVNGEEMFVLKSIVDSKKDVICIIKVIRKIKKWQH